MQKVKICTYNTFYKTLISNLFIVYIYLYLFIYLYIYTYVCTILLIFYLCLKLPHPRAKRICHAYLSFIRSPFDQEDILWFPKIHFSLSQFISNWLNSFPLNIQTNNSHGFERLKWNNAWNTSLYALRDIR